MILLLILFLTGNVLANDPTWKWTNALEVVEKHEFYENDEMITRPKDSWQRLFGIVYNNTNQEKVKDCLYYYVPGEESGILKIKTIQSTESCEKYIFGPGDQEWRNLKALHYSIHKNSLNLSMTNAKFQIERWDVPLFAIFQHPKPKLMMSSAEYRSPKIYFLNPQKGMEKVILGKTKLKKTDEICHDIAEDCSVITPSTCMQCPYGWYEIPNGCQQAPKYCGSLHCGSKNEPACRRGMKYQRLEKEYKCREDQSFVYCAKGLRVQCSGNLPYCI